MKTRRATLVRSPVRTEFTFCDEPGCDLAGGNGEDHARTKRCSFDEESTSADDSMIELSETLLD
jgi:hypothetical protein